jgi:hypothetical protein
VIHDTLTWLQRGLQSIGAGIGLRFRQEPILTGALMRACVVLGTAFFLTWGETQIVAAYAFIEAITAYISRREVTPNVNVQQSQGATP